MAKSAPKPKVISDTEPPSGLPVVRVSLTLDQVLGQERAVDLLRGAMGSGRLHHAWIFGGPAGVGKFTAAMGFAAMLLDPTTEPDLSGRLAADPESPVQRMLREGSHPDLHIITKELAGYSREESVRKGKQRVIPIEVVREFLVEPAARTRVLTGGGESRAGKVFIVDEAELMRGNAQDALLKTLEEPPVGTVIILVTASEDRLSPTVRSRCQRVAFRPLDDSAMKKWLAAHEPAKELAAKPKEWLLRFAGGSPGWAAMAIEHGLFEWHETLAPLLAELDGGRFPVSLGGTMARLVEERAAAWVKANPEASKEAANYAWSRRMLAFVAEHQRQGLREAAARSPERAEWRARAIDLLAEAEEQVGANVNPGMVMENLAAQMAAAPAGA